MEIPVRNAAGTVRLRWLYIALGFAGLALFVMVWRWGGTVADSLAYFNTARYLRGNLGAEHLTAPFPYRLLIPAAAAALPGDLRHTFAFVNWVAVTVAAVTISMTVLQLGHGMKKAVFGGLLLVVSFPTFWFAPYLLVDPGSVAARAGFVLSVVTGHPLIAAVVGIVGTGIREENILLLVWLLATRKIAAAPGLAAMAVAGGWMLLVRWWIIPGLPSYVWHPSFANVMTTLQDTRSLASLVAGAGLVLPLALLGLRRAYGETRQLRSLLVLMTMPVLYAVLCVRVDGRAIWGLYPMLIPFAMAAKMPRWMRFPGNAEIAK